MSRDSAPSEKSGDSEAADETLALSAQHRARAPISLAEGMGALAVRNFGFLVKIQF